ncbi:hypothetical protein [Cupriavidus plantarum]|uniref:hypothetical protein n=1 Tax=Cupriavidus plantarum TaxID=942865 RepID=UPI00339D393D
MTSIELRDRAHTVPDADADRLPEDRQTPSPSVSPTPSRRRAAAETGLPGQPPARTAHGATDRAIPPRRPLARALSATASYAVEKFHQADVVNALAPRQDRAFRAQIDQSRDEGDEGDDAGHAGAALTTQLREHLRAIREDIAEGQGTEAGYRYDIPDAARNRVLRDIARIETSLDGLTQDKSAAASVGLAATRLLLTPLPLLLPLLSHERQRNGVALIVASLCKTWLIAAGLFMNPTANGRVVGQHVLNRDLANSLQAVLLIANIVPTKGAKAVSENVAYNVVVGVAGFVTLMAAFYGAAAATSQYERVRHGAATPGSLGAFTAHLSQESRDFLEGMATRTASQYNALQQARSAFKAGGQRLTNTADWHVSQVLGGLQHLKDDMLRLAGVQQPAGLVSRNEDKVSKGIMLGISAAVLFAPIIPVTGLAIKPRPETIPLVDLLIDYAFTMFHMGAIFRNPGASVQQSQDAFSQWVGFSGVMAFCYGANAALGDPIAKDDKAWGKFIAGLSIANTTVATPLGTTMADAVSLVFSLLRRGDRDGAGRQLAEIGEAIMAARPEAPQPEADDAARIVEVREPEVHEPEVHEPEVHEHQAAAETSRPV